MRCLSFLRLKLFKLLVYQNRQNFKTVQQHFLKVSAIFPSETVADPESVMLGGEKKLSRAKIKFYLEIIQNNLKKKTMYFCTL